MNERREIDERTEKVNEEWKKEKWSCWMNDPCSIRTGNSSLNLWHTFMHTLLMKYNC